MFATLNIQYYNRNPPWDTARLVHNSIKKMGTGRTLAQFYQVTRQLVVMPGQPSVRLFQAQTGNKGIAQ